MNGTRQVAEGSPAEELGRRYREAGDPVECSHYQMIAWSLARGRTAAREVADATAYSERWVREIARLYAEHGVGGSGIAGTPTPTAPGRRCLRPSRWGS